MMDRLGVTDILKEAPKDILVDPKKNSKKGFEGKIDQGADILEGVDLDKIKKRYKKGEAKEFDMKDIEQFMDENDDDAYKILDSANIDYNVFGDTNEAEFKKNKEQLIEDAVPEEQKAMVGWGDWTGAGIVVKPIDPNVAKQQAIKKLQKIDSIRQKRKDRGNDNIVLHEGRNKLIKKYLVDELPLNVKSAEQFDYLNNKPLSSEWNGIVHQERLTKPKVQTRAGEIITPLGGAFKKKKFD